MNRIFIMIIFMTFLVANHAGAVPVGDWDFCSKQNPCSAGQGDCDSDDECKPGLKCMKDVGPQYGFDKGVDVCVGSATSSTSSSTSSTSGEFGGGVSSSTSSSSTSTSSSSGCTGIDLLLGKCSTSSSSSTTSTSSSTTSGGVCQLPLGHRDYCATCGPCTEGQGMCVRDYQCVSGLVCVNGTCVKPATNQ